MERLALNGRLLRNGANPQTGESLHWFLGNGMLHGVEIADGSANWYHSRYVKTPLYLNPDADIMSGLGDMSMSAANTHVIKHAGKILALKRSLAFELSRTSKHWSHNYGGNPRTDDSAPKYVPRRVSY